MPLTDLWPAELGENKFCCFKTRSLWKFVTTALEKGNDKNYGFSFLPLLPATTEHFKMKGPRVPPFFFPEYLNFPGLKMEKGGEA